MIYGSNNLFNDVRDLYLQEFEQAQNGYNEKQIRFDDNDNRIVNDVARKIKPADELNNTNIKKKNNMELK